MQTTAYKNELAKRNYYKFLGGAKQRSPKTVSRHENAIWIWEEFSSHADFAGFNKAKAEEFKDWLKDKKKKAGEPIGLSYQHDILRFLRSFFGWLALQPRYRRINQTDIEYLRLTIGETRIATQPKRKQFPTFEEIKMLIEGIKGKSEVEMRDKALLSLTYLITPRISALMTLPMASFDRKNLTIDQDPKLGIEIKNSKRFVAVFLPFHYPETVNYFLEWYDYLENVKKFKPTDPIFPATKRKNGGENLGYYSSDEVEPIFWKSTSSPRNIFKKRSEQAGIKYYHPHSFRDYLVKEISKLSITEEEKKAFSQNLGHEKTGTTFGSYGEIKMDDDRQIEIIRDYLSGQKQREGRVDLSNAELLEVIANKLKD